MLKLYRHMANLAISGLYTSLSFARGRKRPKAAWGLCVFGRCATLEGIDTGTVCVMGPKRCSTATLASRRGLRGLRHNRKTRTASESGLVKVGHIEASLEEMRWLPKGALVGSGATVRLRRPTLTATLDVGWYKRSGCAAALRRASFSDA